MNPGVETDNELMLRFQRERDFRAFERLFVRHTDALLSFVARQVASRASAEDACQHTWLKVIEVGRNGSYSDRGGAAFRSWLFKLARNHVIDEHHRKHAATRTVPLPEDAHPETWGNYPGSAVDPLSYVARQQSAERIVAALALLPVEQRQVIAMWVAGVNPADIAALTAAPRETVLSRKKYAIAKLRKALLGRA